MPGIFFAPVFTKQSIWCKVHYIYDIVGSMKPHIRNSKTVLEQMATSRLLSRPPAGGATLRSWSCSSRSCVPSCTQNSSSKDNSQQALSLSGGMGSTSASLSTLFAGKVATRAGVSQPVTSQGFDVVILWENVVGLVVSIALGVANWKLTPVQAQALIEKLIVDCRFFTFLAVAGSLLGSILCFVEGFMMVLQSYLRYFGAMLRKLDHGSTVEILVEAIDMFLVGTAMLIFSMGLYVMFIKSKNTNHLSKSNMMLPSWLKMESVSEAKTRIGHAVLMILQVGMLDKFKSVPLVTGSDLASFAGAVLLSSASIFCLSKLSRSDTQQG